MATTTTKTSGKGGLALLVLAVAGLTAAAEDKPLELKVGDRAPTFQSVDDQAQPWKSADHVGKKFLVVYFYPGDFTPGCTRQAQAFRDNMNQLTEKGVEVVGVSGDAAATHQLFKKAQQLNFTLLADEEGNLAKQFGVPVGKGGDVRIKGADGQLMMLKRNVTFSRWTFVIGKDGKVIYKNSNVNPAQDSKQVADFVEKQARP
jgi:peroxiredoxin Q/BCP